MVANLAHIDVIVLETIMNSYCKNCSITIDEQQRLTSKHERGRHLCGVCQYKYPLIQDREPFLTEEEIAEATAEAIQITKTWIE